MNIALLILDIQEAYMAGSRGESTYERTLEYINETAKMFREHGKPIVIVRHLSGEDGEEFQNAKELIAEESDVDVIKRYQNAFWKTDLEEILRAKDVDFVVVCGLTAEFCVLATYNGAMERDFTVALLQKGLFADSEAGLQNMVENRNQISYGILSYLLKNG